MIVFQFMRLNISLMRSLVNRQSGDFFHHNCNMNTFSERVRSRRKELGLSQKDLADATGLSQTTISDIERGRNDGSREVVALAKVLRVQAQWLAYGLQPKELGMDETGYDNIVQGIRIPVTKTNKVPVVGTAQLGDDGYWAEIDYPTGYGDGFVEFYCRDNNAYAVRCRGSSMMPRIRDGEFVVLETKASPIPGDDVLVKHMDGRVMVKHYLYERDGMIQLMSINEAFPPHAFPRAEIELFHKVCGIATSFHWVQE
jgi:phage repressor protein C with HTH and peptisase S24 domain